MKLFDDLKFGTEVSIKWVGRFGLKVIKDEDAKFQCSNVPKFQRHSFQIDAYLK